MADVVKPQFFVPTPDGGIPVDVDSSEVADKLAAGEIVAQKGQMIPMVEPETNKKVFLPAEDAAEAIKSGYMYDAPEAQQERVDKTNYGKTATSQLEALAAAAARGVSFGTSDLALTKFGVVEPETLEKLKKYNPGLSLTGEIAGAALPALLSAGASAPASAAATTAALAKGEIGKAALKGLTTAAKVSIGAPEALSYVGRKAAEKIAARATIESGMVAGGLKLASKVAPFAIEGAGYGAGAALSEAALGDPDNVAEHFLATVGPQALMGAAMGVAALPVIKTIEAGAGAIAGGLEHIKSKSTQEPLAAVDLMAEKRAAKAVENTLDGNPGEVSAEIKYGPPQNAVEPVDLTLKRVGASDDVIENVKAGLSELKKNSKEIEDAALRQGLGLSPGQVSANETVQKVDTWLSRLHGTTTGMLKQKFWKDNFERVAENFKTVIGDVSEASSAQTGNRLKEAIDAKVRASYEPISQMFEEVKAITGTIPAQKKAVTKAIEQLKSIEGYGLKTHKELTSFINQAAHDLEMAPDASMINTIRSGIQQSGSGAVSQAAKHAMEEIIPVLEQAYEDTVLGYAKTALAKGKYQALLDRHKKAKAVYKSYIEELNYISKKLGKKRPGGTYGFLNHLDEMTPEKVARAIFDSKDSEFITYFSKRFPNEFEMMRSNYLGNLLAKHTKDESLNTIRVLREIRDPKKVSPELFDLMFTKEQRQTIKDLNVWLESVPEKIRPDTAEALTLDALISEGGHTPSGIMKLVGKNMGAAMANDALNAAVRPDKSQAYKYFLEMADTVKRSKDGFISGVQNLVKEKTIKAAEKVAIPATVKTGLEVKKTLEERKEEHKKHKEVAIKTIEQVKRLAGNPSVIQEMVAEKTKNMAVMSPKVASAIAQKTIAGANYLAMNMPTDPLASSSMGTSEWTPSDYEIGKWNRIYTAVQKPMSVIQDLKENKATKESVDALRAVYPGIYNEVVQEAISGLSESKKVPYSARNQLAILFGVPSHYTLRPDFISKMQLQHKINSGPIEGNVNSGKIRVAESSKSDVERTMTRG